MPDTTRSLDPHLTLPADIAVAAEPPSPPGYDLLEEFGRGGMGVVFRARDQALDREVAVKMLQARFAPDSDVARRFMDEARITGQLQHPGIPPVYQVGKLSDGRPFLAMKLIQGLTLEAMLKAAAPLDPLAVCEAVGQTVGYAHAHGVIHRDMKPSNIMVGPFGEVQVMDWGLAKVLTGDDGPDRPDAPDGPPADSPEPVTRHGIILGTPAFMAPEQAAGEPGKVGPPADVFGLGAILCVLLTGKPPFDGKDVESVRRNAARGTTAEAFARLDACGADPDVIALCKRCLAFDPADRPADGRAVAAEVAVLRRAADDRAGLAERDKLAAEVRAAEQVKRRRADRRAAAVVAAVLLGGVLGTSAGMYQAVLARHRAEAAESLATGRSEEAFASAAAAKAARDEAVGKEAEARAVLRFVEGKVFAAARPKGQEGGLGWDVQLRDALAASLPGLTDEFTDQPLVEARLRLTLGRTFYHLGDSANAISQLERAKAIFADRRGPNHPDTLESKISLARSYSLIGHHPNTLPLWEEVLTAQRQVLEADHPEVLASMAALATSYAVAGRQSDALRLRQEVLTARRRVLPTDHPDTLASMHGLANSYAAAGRHSDALDLRQEALAGRRRVLPANHPDTLASMTALALSYSASGRHLEALGLRQEALAARRQVLPPGHPHTLASLGGVAESLVQLNRGAEAIPLIDECVVTAANSGIPLRLLASVLDLRLRHFHKAGDPAGCRATAEMWERLNQADADSLLTSARMRAVSAGRYATVNQPAEATADTDRAMAWLTKAIAAGYRDRRRIDQDKDLDALRGRADFRALIAPLPYLAPPPRPVR